MIDSAVQDVLSYILVRHRKYFCALEALLNVETQAHVSLIARRP